jgi:hypothetical protein
MSAPLLKKYSIGSRKQPCLRQGGERLGPHLVETPPPRPACHLSVLPRQQRTEVLAVMLAHAVKSDLQTIHRRVSNDHNDDRAGLAYHAYRSLPCLSELGKGPVQACAPNGRARMLLTKICQRVSTQNFQKGPKLIVGSGLKKLAWTNLTASHSTSLQAR